MIAHARHDEKGQYSGGAAGDQDGTEVAVTEWYSRPWDYVLRAQDTPTRWKIADYAEIIANCDLVGYDQNQRRTLYEELKKHNMDPTQITNKCECDCSSLVAVCCILAGVNVSPDIYTGNEREALKKLGFNVLKDSKYTKSADYLVKGDILLYENHHTAINLTDGKDAVLFPVQGWNKDRGACQKNANCSGWWYAWSATRYYCKQWKIINHYYYYFDENGYAVKGVQKIDGKLYYFLNDGTTGKLECALCKTNADGALTPYYID